MFGQDQLEPVHLVAELADLAFLSGDEGADCRRVVRWQVTVGEQFRGVPVVLPDDALVAVHGDGQAACVCSIESGPCERVESLQMSGRF